jgi:hypothetical protein
MKFFSRSGDVLSPFPSQKFHQGANMTEAQKRFVVAFTAFCLLAGIAALGTSFWHERDLEKNGINIETLLSGGKR